MAVKAALAAALLVALVAMASATTYTTTVTTTNYEEEDRSHQCSQQLQGRQFRSCQRYFEQRSSGPHEEEEEEEEGIIEMSTGRMQHHEQYLQQCCQQLKEMDRQQCGCEAIKHAVKQAQQGGGRYHHAGQSEQIYQKARSLPRMCGLSDQQCRFRVVFV